MIYRNLFTLHKSRNQMRKSKPKKRNLKDISK